VQACGAAMVTTDPTGAARAKGDGDLFFFFSNSFLNFCGNVGREAGKFFRRFFHKFF
jgi:hypothetical protein